VRDKVKLTETLVAQLDPDLGFTAETAYTTWWHNIRANGGMRLTEMGYRVLSELLKLEHYSFTVYPLAVTSRLIIDMDRRLQQPYYIRMIKHYPREVIFFGSKEAMMANLYGDLKKFIDNYGT
jgi:hypothetical protein